MQKLVPLLVAASSLLLALPAWAHVDLDWPLMASTTQKDGPCGTPDAAADTFYFRPGQTITVRYTEFFSHPGHFRVAFAPTEGDLTSPLDCGDVKAPGTVVGNMTVLADGEHLAESANDDAMGCPGRVGTRTPGSDVPYTSTITFPDQECEDCLLQVIQFMTDKPPLGDAGGNDLYFRCAFVTLTNDPAIEPSVDPEAVDGGGADAGPDAGAGGGGSGDDDAGTGGSGTGETAGPNQLSGGCRAGSSALGLGAGAVLAVIVAALGIGPRRRRSYVTRR